MSEIHVLENNLINKIAAGEVVERPASVVKELLENSVDANATSISVEISGGGIDFIKIIDNGVGIPKNQVKTAFLRHATSKLEKFEDLGDILTLGFRGEALSSIASVSQVELITKTAAEQTGTKIEISANEIISESDVGAVVGTSFTMRNLFFNTPARRNFLKKAGTESGYVNEVVTRLALGHPEIAFKYINNKSLILQTSGNNNLKTCVFHVYGKEISSKTVEVYSEKNGYKLSGLVVLPELSRAARNYENFFINGRFIKSKLVSTAVEDAFRGKLMGGRFPIFVLNLKVPANTVDVNVHPTKLEARFSDEDFIYQLVYDAVYSALKNEVLIPSVKIQEKNIINENTVKENSPEQTINTNNRQALAEKLKSELLVIEDVSSNSKADPLDGLLDDTPINTSGIVYVGESDGSFSQNKNEKPTYFEKSLPPKDIKNVELQDLKAENLKETGFETPNKPSTPPQTKVSKNNFFTNYKIVGQVFKTYWIIEQADNIYIIDQHAAHERAIYEELTEKLKNQEVISQRLLQPVTVDLSEREQAVLKENKQLIENFGFEIEEFGKNTYAIRSVPYIFKNPADISFFKDILEMLFEKNFENIYDTKTDAIATMACKAAVKGNDRLDYLEAKALIEKIIRLENPFNCPHGRPTIVKLTKYDFEKFFKRVL